MCLIQYHYLLFYYLMYFGRIFLSLFYKLTVNFKLIESINDRILSSYELVCEHFIFFFYICEAKLELKIGRQCEVPSIKAANIQLLCWSDNMKKNNQTKHPSMREANYCKRSRQPIVYQRGPQVHDNRGYSGNIFRHRIQGN